MLIRIGELDTYYAEVGRGDPVVLLHGWGTSSRSLAGLVESLAETHRVLTVDLPGFGWSQPPPVAWGTAEYAAHVAQLLRQTGIAPGVLVGHSFGGRIAIVLAAGQPACVSRLVLVASAGIRPPRGPGHYLRVGAARAVKRLFSLPGWGRRGQRIIAAVSQRVGSRDYRLAGRMRPTLVRVINEDLTAMLPMIQAPTLILWGDRDQEVPRGAMEIMAAKIPHARLVIFGGAGHFPFLDAPQEFHRVVTAFLQSEGSV